LSGKHPSAFCLLQAFRPKACSAIDRNALVFALVPSRLDELVAAMNALSRDQRRLIGLAGLAIGAVLIWLSGGG